MQDGFNQTIIVAEGWHEPVALHEEQMSPHDQLIREMSSVAMELEQVTRTKEGCDQFLDDLDKFFSAAICFSLAANRLRARLND